LSTELLWGWWLRVPGCRRAGHVVVAAVREDDPVAGAGDHRAEGGGHLDRAEIVERAALLPQPLPQDVAGLGVFRRGHAQRGAVVELGGGSDRGHTMQAKIASVTRTLIDQQNQRPPLRGFTF